MEYIASGDGGGGINCYDSDPTITNCTISQNRASGSSYCDGGGIRFVESNPTITNCTISENFSENDAGGIYANSIMTITNCTISGNQAMERGGGIYGSDPDTTIKNCILWGNSAPSGPEILVFSGSPMVTYSDVQGGWEGVGNIDADPLFVEAGDYHLTEGSPCIDAGDPDPLYDDLCHPPSMGTERNDMGVFGGPGVCGWCGDYDGDGFEAVACGGEDCDDADAATFPGAGEICDGKDNNCDGYIPFVEGDLEVDGWMICHGDCDDSDPAVFPGAKELCDGKDTDCDGAIAYVELIDGDEDGWLYCADCDDSDPDLNPGADEICDNGIDDDCDGLIDLYDLGCGVLQVPAMFPTIQAGIFWAVDGDIVLVAPGTYREIIEFYGKEITLQSEAGADVTVIDGMSLWSVVTFSWGENENSVIDGFTIRNGSGTFFIEGVCPPYSEFIAGGGIYCSSSPTIANCKITGNSAADYGGGIYCSESSPTITNCTISDNWSRRGGGIKSNNSTPTITNCTVSGNSAIEICGGIYCDYSHPTTTITNCIFWGNTPYGIGGSPTVSYSDVQGGYIGEGNIDADPLFVGEGDYRLVEGSPCIDAGNPAPSYNDLCFPPSMGTERNDMGAYGGPGACDWMRFLLELDALYVLGFLNLNFTLATPEPALWSTSLILTFPTIHLIPLWPVPLPVIYPPMEIPISFPFPSLGWIGIFVGLYADFDLQPESFDFVWVDTGW